jgi:hypothetical protein
MGRSSMKQEKAEEEVCDVAHCTLVLAGHLPAEYGRAENCSKSGTGMWMGTS